MSWMENLTIGAEGYIGVAIETTPNDYQAPTKFFPIMSETLQWQQATNERRVIRGTADVIGAVPGNGHVEGNIETELLADVLPYFLMAARGTLTQTAGTPNEYEFVPLHGARAPNTLSITIVRGGEAFGYVGCNVASMTFGVDNDMATSSFSILGAREEAVAVPAAPTYADDVPFGAGTWNLQIPSNTQVFDSDNFSFEVDDNGEVQNRLKNELGAQFIAFGERNVSMSIDRDFHSRDDYNDFKALVEKSVAVAVTHNAGTVQLEMPVAYTETYEVSLSGVGDLVRASTNYHGIHDDTTGGAYSVHIETEEDLGIAA